VSLRAKCDRSVATIAGAIRAAANQGAVQSATRTPLPEVVTAIACARCAVPPVSTTAVAIEEIASRLIRYAVGATTSAARKESARRGAVTVTLATVKRTSGRIARPS
jgi:hypothetical protein